MTPYANGDTVPGGAYVAFMISGACSRLIGPDITFSQVEKAFEDVTKGEVKPTSMNLDDSNPLFDDVAEIVVRVMTAMDAATLRGKIANSISAMNTIHIPLVYGCRGMKLADGVLYQPKPAVEGEKPKPPSAAVTWQAAILVVGIGIIAIAALIGVREFKASTGLA